MNVINTRNEERSVREVHSDAVTSITFVNDFIITASLDKKIIQSSV